MALLWLDGFETYGALGASGSALVAELIRRYPNVYMSDATTTPATEIVDGLGNGLALQPGRSQYEFHLVATFATNLTWIIGEAIFVPNDYVTASDIFTIQSYNGTVQNKLTLAGDLSLRAYRGDASLFLGRSSKSLKRNTWHYLEYKVYCHDSSGTVDVQLDGENILSLTGVDTLQDATGYLGTIVLRAPRSSSSGNVHGAIDDLYILDGAAGLSDFLGPVKVETLRPTGDTATINWTTSSGSDHYALVDENPVNASDYVYSATANQEDKYTLTNLTYLSSINGVQLGIMAQLDGPGTKQVYVTCDSNGSIDTGTEVYLADTTSLHFSRILENDPNTSNAWTSSAINALIAGIKVK